MPGPRAPCDYSKEPPRHPILLINSKEPFNAEPPRLSLISSYVTPVDFFYKRNHGPVPIVDDIERFIHQISLDFKIPLDNLSTMGVVCSAGKIQNFSGCMSSYRVCIGGLVEKPIELSMADIKKLPKYNVTATLQCAGNRRTAMSKVRAVKGVGWDISAIGNGGKHVEFVSVDMCKEEKGGPFKASIPLIQSTNSEADVLLAYEMNGELLNRDHGYPLRVVVPGVIGAHSVKWLDSINIIGEECQGFFMQKDYKMFPSSVKWENIDWSTQKPQMDFPVQSAICSLEDDNTVQHGKVKVHGYAASGGGRAALKDSMYHLMVARHGWKHPDTKRVEFHIMLLLMMINIVTNGHGCFLKLKVMSSTIQRLLPKLLTAANVQPENVAVIWNLRGILNNSWHRIQIHVKDK